MTRALWQRHRVIVLAMGILFPIAFAMAIAARKTVPILDALPAALASPAGPFEPVAWNGAGLFAKAPVEARFRCMKRHLRRLALELSAPKDFVKPDLIVYWAPGNPHLSPLLARGCNTAGRIWFWRVAFAPGNGSQRWGKNWFFTVSRKMKSLTCPSRCASVNPDNNNLAAHERRIQSSSMESPEESI